MTIKEFYEIIHGDYEEIYSRFSADALILRFIRRFPSDLTYEELMEAVKNADIPASFVAAHKLKGLAANFAFSELYDALSELSEQLRPQTETADTLLVQKVRESYHSILHAIKCLEDEDVVYEET